MYFVTQGGGVYHALNDEKKGRALCGARLSRFDLMLLKNGRATPQVFEEKPTGVLPCKLCESWKRR
jgi:hypothetical protein